jgi:hypothetical protein
VLLPVVATVLPPAASHALRCTIVIGEALSPIP